MFICWFQGFRCFPATVLNSFICSTSRGHHVRIRCLLNDTTMSAPNLSPRVYVKEFSLNSLLQCLSPVALWKHLYSRNKAAKMTKKAQVNMKLQNLNCQGKQYWLLIMKNYNGTLIHLDIFSLPTICSIIFISVGP